MMLIGIMAISSLVVVNFTTMPVMELNYEAEFNKFISQYSKSYKTVEEYQNRLEIFTENLMNVNDNQESFNLGINQFSDMTTEEYQGIMINQVPIKVEHLEGNLIH
jgi:hypothetical protein